MYHVLLIFLRDYFTFQTFILCTMMKYFIYMLIVIVYFEQYHLKLTHYIELNNRNSAIKKLSVLVGVHILILNLNFYHILTSINLLFYLCLQISIIINVFWFYTTFWSNGSTYYIDFFSQIINWYLNCIYSKHLLYIRQAVNRIFQNFQFNKTSIWI